MGPLFCQRVPVIPGGRVMAALKVVSAGGMRYAPNAPAWKGEDVGLRLRKGERLREHPVMVRDLDDESHIILDCMIIMGHDRKAKRATARAIIQVGRHPGLKHKGDYYVTAAEVLYYQPICALEIKVAQADDKNYSSRALFLALQQHVWTILRKSQGLRQGSFWLATYGKRSLRHAQEGVIKGMRYSHVRDNWRVPANRASEVRRRNAIRRELKEQAAWAFEKVETATGGAI